MLIGVIADTHDNMDKLKKAVDLFNERAVELVLHAGDYIAPFTSRELRRLARGQEHRGDPGPCRHAGGADQPVRAENRDEERTS